MHDSRIIIENIHPSIEGGRFPVKKILKDKATVQADIFTDGHEKITCEILASPNQQDWKIAEMFQVADDRWSADIELNSLGYFYFKIRAKREYAPFFEESKIYEFLVDPPEAAFSSWYEIFSRSFGTFKRCEELLPEIQKLGFNILYLAPIHPIGLTNRKGRDNDLIYSDSDPGSPWAIGSPEGGHKSIDPSLGTLDDFVHFIKKAQEFEIKIAMDIAFQTSMDHPYIKEHPDWFLWRPDGTIQYAENPPKKYEDIVPFNFDTASWKGLWEELKDILLFWIDKGISVFRVDNPHTKPFRFWEWLIREIKTAHPQVIFLSEAFTRRKVMNYLAKIGFTQSYTYFAWRESKQDLIDYFKELRENRLFFRPNFWPNTPDILTPLLQKGGKPAFIQRFVLAATLSTNYGIYGPPFRLLQSEAAHEREEYRPSEKYELIKWDFSNTSEIDHIITKINQLRNNCTALQQMWDLEFVEISNVSLLAYIKWSPLEKILIVVNLNPYGTEAGELNLNIETAEDLMTGERISDLKRVVLNPQITPFQIFKIWTRQ